MSEGDPASGSSVARLLAIAKAIPVAWRPAPALDVNQAKLRVVRFDGAFARFHHHDVDECYVVLEGELAVEIQGGETTTLGRGDAFVVRAGTVHRPVASTTASVLLIT